MLSGPLKIVICLALFLLSVFFFFFFKCLKLPCMKIYKHAFLQKKAPLFYSRLGSPASLFSSTPVPRSRSTKTATSRMTIYILPLCPSIPSHLRFGTGDLIVTLQAELTSVLRDGGAEVEKKSRSLNRHAASFKLRTSYLSLFYVSE